MKVILGFLGEPKIRNAWEEIDWDVVFVELFHKKP